MGIKFTVIYRYMRIFMGIKKLSNSRYEFYTRKYLLKEVKITLNIYTLLEAMFMIT